MKFKTLIIVVFLLMIAGALLYYVSIRQNQKVGVDLIKNESVKLTPLSSPTLTPVIIDQNSKLKLEVEKLIPDDFSEDFKMLQNETSDF